MPVTTTTTLSPQVIAAFHERLLATPTPNKIYSIPAERAQMPANKGDKLIFTRYNRLPAALVPLGNTGVTPPSTPLTAVNIEAQYSTYGQWVEISELVTLQRNDRVLNAAVKQLGEGLMRTEDELVRNMLTATASTINCTAGVNGDNPTEITASDIDDVCAALMGADGKYFTDVVPGENRFGTAPVKNAYFALADTDIIPSLRNVANFVESSQYANQAAVLPSEYGTAGHLRFLVTSDGSVTATSSNLGADVYNVICVAQEAYGIIYPDQYSTQLIYNPPYLSGPLHLTSTMGYKFGQGQAIYNDELVINLKCTL